MTECRCSNGINTFARKMIKYSIYDRHKSKSLNSYQGLFEPAVKPDWTRHTGKGNTYVERQIWQVDETDVSVTR